MTSAQQATTSLADRLRTHPQRAQIIASLGNEIAGSLLTSWPFWRRPSQAMPSGRWLIWLILAGRGYGKTRTGVETLLDLIESRERDGAETLCALVARTSRDVRDTLILGVSGVSALARNRGWGVKYEPSKSQVVLMLPDGRRARLMSYSAVEPDAIRGPSLHFALCDEYAAWPHKVDSKGNTALSNLRMALREGIWPRLIIATTPKAGHRGLRDLIADRDVAVTQGATHENLGNLAPGFARTVLAYEGTSIAGQELRGEMTDAVDGALVTPELWASRVHTRGTPPPLAYSVLAVDPAVTGNESSDATGIIHMGVERMGETPVHVLGDYSHHGGPTETMRHVAKLWRSLGADAVVVEVNNGGDYIPEMLNLLDPAIPVETVRATTGKMPRAKPVATMLEQGLVHIWGDMGDLGSEWCTWVPDVGADSPDRMDAMVWGAWHLVLDAEPPYLLSYGTDDDGGGGMIHPVLGVRLDPDEILERGRRDDE